MGILLIAIDAWGSGYYYQLAYNMALSLKLSDPKTQIALLTDNKDLPHLSELQKKVFDTIIQAEDEDYTEEFKYNPFKLKTKIYKYTPFAKTLYMDVDGLFLNQYKNINDLFAVLAGTDFQIHEVSRYTKENAHQSGMIWTRPTEGSENAFPKLWDVYGCDDDALMPEYNSSFIYFVKNESNEKYFKQVEHNYNDRRLPYKDIGTSYPDEMAWNIASAQLKHYGAIPTFKPCYLEWDHTAKELDYIGKSSWVLMLASGYQLTKMMAFYDNMVKSNRAKHGDNVPFNFEMRKKIFFRK